MKKLLIVAVLMGGVSGCTIFGQTITGAQIAADATAFCQNEGALATVLAQDGTVLKASPGQTQAIAQGSQLVAINCAALLAVLQTAPASPTAMVPWARTALPKLGFTHEQVERIIRRYR